MSSSQEVGDCARLREALQTIHDRVNALDEECGVDPVEIRDIARAALAAPARNCDLARDWLHDLYANFKPPASVRREMPPEWVDAVMAFCRWLVKPAKEGGAE